MIKIPVKFRKDRYKTSEELRSQGPHYKLRTMQKNLPY